MADTPVWAGQVPHLITGAYQKKQFRSGLAGGIQETVFDALAYPPESGVEATEA
ncbi:hypothetical protein SEA_PHRAPPUCCINO_61 [Mycobacterium phage Phrappuccino]|uniref:Uncharacterized protein n=1 Tax=Mycobacterium phage Phrappuccino TaxID=2591223 RepID=A0A514DDP5_9CAUD|nr:hypothetical protein KHQ87_gp061 [Mycobacterium phage Phrappuccino]QDH91736.1 hypothetical protein SEA_PHRAPPUCCINO_61 [Mycobacterium phage Phrappuccino]QIQ63179.1 hypothetical protein SEA_SETTECANDELA_61 [Mycobacterium phage Settecandela]